jgi:rubredoxin
LKTGSKPVEKLEIQRENEETGSIISTPPGSEYGLSQQKIQPSPYFLFPLLLLYFGTFEDVERDPGMKARASSGEKREGIALMAKPEDMWQCQTVNCGYIYDPDRGDRKGKIPKGTRFEDLPEDWKCPVCGAGKKMFRPLAGPGSVAAEGI